MHSKMKHSINNRSELTIKIFENDKKVNKDHLFIPSLH